MLHLLLFKSQITIKFTSKCMLSVGTHVKTHKLVQVYKQVVTNLLTSCQQVMFALLPSLLQQVWTKLPTTCHKFDGIITLNCYNVVLTSLIQS